MEKTTLLPRQTNWETEKWKIALHHLQQQNIIQKNKLVEMLKFSQERRENLLEIAEQYQNQFLQQDEALRFMWNDLVKLERLACVQSTKNENDPVAINYRLDKVRKEIENLQLHFRQLQSHFLNFFEAFLQHD